MNKTATQAVMTASQGVVHQKVVFGSKAHAKLLEGATILAEAVGSTMGPSGHNVIIDGTVGAPLITKDGVTVAKSINLRERLPSMGAELLKEVASKTNELAGDGTTTATVLAHAMLKEGIKMIATGRDAIYVKKGMDFATEKVIEVLKKNCIPVRNSQDIINVGTISANGDVKVGELLSQAIDKVGQDGIITIEPGKSTQTTLEVAEGMQFDGGYLSPYFVTNSEKNTVELINPFILLTNRKISALADFIPILEKVANTNNPLLVIADDVEGEALHTLIVNKFKGTLASCAVKAPSYGENRTDILGDIAAVVGGMVLDASNAQALKNLSLESLGMAAKVIVTRTSTTIVGEPSEAARQAIDERVKGLKTALNSDGSLDELHIDRYKKRLAKLAGGVAVVRVGGSTEVEILEKKDRVEDALNATIAAAQEGIVPGGGSALFYAQKEVGDWFNRTVSEGWGEDFNAGVQVILNACQAPLRTIVANTGKSPDVVMDKLAQKAHLLATKKEIADSCKVSGLEENWIKTTIQPESTTRFGYDAAKGQYGDLIDRGIIDPVKVTRFALEHANSVVGLILTCNSVVLNEMSSDDEQTG
jgi:chaperonin GroEL